MKEIRRFIFIILIALGSGFLFIYKPIHIDEANFLALTQGTFSAPHNIWINWQGKTERAFDVLSNPPGIAWYLWPLRHHDPVWMRVWMMPWILVLLWGVRTLAKNFKIQPDVLLLLTLFSPMVFVSIGSVMPDVPLLALYILGIAKVMSSKHKSLWAMVGGCSSLFRYSGLTFIPLVFLLGLRESPQKALRYTIFASVPFVLLFLNDVYSYGGSHFLHMISFQQSESSSWLSKFPALMGMLSGGLLFPLIPKTQKDLWFYAVALGISVGFIQVYQAPWYNVIWVSGGISLLLNTVRNKGENTRFLFFWTFGALIFLLQLRFVATRYWLPFFIPILICVVQRAKYWERHFLIIWGMILSFSLAIDDYGFAKAHKEAVDFVSKKEKGLFAGHWGWQYYLERQGWRSVEADQTLPVGGWFARINTAWPQEVQGCRVLEAEKKIEGHGWIRGHTFRGKANLHASHLSDGQVVLVPWSFSQESYVHVQLFRLSCP